MNQKTQWSIGIVVIALLLAGAGFYIYRDTASRSFGEPAATTTKNGIEYSGDATIDGIPVVNITIPDLERFIVAADVPAEQRANYIAKMQEYSAVLKKDPTQYPYWLELATSRQKAGDFEGARIIWEYQTQMWSDQFVPFFNLGSLYTSDLKNPAKAEEYYRKALMLRPAGPESINTYLAMHDLYVGGFKAKEHLADDILFEGLEQNPDNLSLLYRLGAYYRDTGDTVNARKYFEEALAAARAEGDAKAEAQIEAWLATL